MKSTASLTGMEYFSLVSIPSSKIAVAFQWMFLRKRTTALVENGKRTDASTNVKKTSALFLKYRGDIVASFAEPWGHFSFGQSGKRMVQSAIRGREASLIQDQLEITGKDPFILVLQTLFARDSDSCESHPVDHDGHSSKYVNKA